MKQAAIRDTETHALEQSIETIRERIDSLGVSEPVIEQYGLGENQILVELPGVTDNIDRVRDMIQSTAKLEVHAAVSPSGFDTEAAALQAAGGALPPDEEILKGSASGSGPDQFWLLKRPTIVEGLDFRDAQPTNDENNRPNVTFNLTTAAGDRFYKYTDAATT